MGYNIKNLNNNNIIFYFLLILIILAGGNLFNRFFNNNKENIVGGMMGGNGNSEDDDSNQQQQQQTEPTEDIDCEKTYGSNTNSFNYKKCETNNIITKINNEVANPAQNNKVYNETEIKEKEKLISSAYQTHKQFIKYKYLRDTPIETIKSFISRSFTSTDSSEQDTAIIDLEKAYNNINVGGALGSMGGGFKNATGVLSY